MKWALQSGEVAMNYQTRSLWVLAGLALILLPIAGYVYIAENPVSRADPRNKKLVSHGQSLYGLHCSSCHGQGLQGQKGWQVLSHMGTLGAPPHDQSGHTWHHGDQMLFDYIKEGDHSLFSANVKRTMPGFADKLDDREIWSILAYIKSHWNPQQLDRQKRMTLREKDI